MQSPFQHNKVMSDITAQILLKAYSIGIFPMSESQDDPSLFWVDPDQRGIFDLNSFHISKSLARQIRREPFTITLNHGFLDVVRKCADREETWINAVLFKLYGELHDMGYAHSIEVRDQNKLVGGVFGLAIGGAFFGDSMFSTKTDASKIALAYLTRHLSNCGFTLFDTQFITPHLASLGAIEIPRRDYKNRLSKALILNTSIEQDLPTAYSVLQRSAHTS